MLKFARYGIAAFVIMAGAAQASDLDPKAIAIKLPSEIVWSKPTDEGLQTMIVAGDPNKPQMYALLAKWPKGHMSHPHYHETDRFITVVSGTWWVGTGDKWDPKASAPVPAGSIVTHFAKQVHWDGAKDTDVILLITGVGPSAQIPSPTAH